MNNKIDPRVREYFKNIKQVFIYIIDECNLSCVQCLYKPNLTFRIKDKEIPLETANALISDFREMGARKLTIMGGEPTLYGADKEWSPLLAVISNAKMIGYEYVRVDTNGQFDARLLLKKDFFKLDEITFSLDGHTSEINDPVRGKGSFEKCTSNIRRAVELGYNVNITSCLHKGMLFRYPDGNLALDKMILFAEELGVPVINFHDLFVKYPFFRQVVISDFLKKMVKNYLIVIDIFSAANSYLLANMAGGHFKAVWMRR